MFVAGAAANGWTLHPQTPEAVTVGFATKK